MTQKFEYATTTQPEEAGRSLRIDLKKCTPVEIAIFVLFILTPYLGTFTTFIQGNNRIDQQEWFDLLIKPSWQPPNYLFGPVWAVLYAWIGMAGYLAFRGGRNLPGSAPKGGGDLIGEESRLPYFKDRKIKLVMALYVVNLLLNWLWTPLFFAAHEIQWALVEICAVWVTVVALMGLFWPYSPWSTLLFAPYLAWVTFATALNGTILGLNRDNDFLPPDAVNATTSMATSTGLPASTAMETSTAAANATSV